MAEVKLIGFWSSPYVDRVKWALGLKGVEYEYIEEDVFNKSELLSKFNPVHKKVPVLVHDGKPIAESVVILEYIEETWPHNHPLLPKDPYERAVARFWTRFADVESYTLFTFFTAKTAEGKEKADNEAKEVLKNLEEYLGDNKFFSGDEIGMIDLCLGWIACVLELMEIAAEVKLLEADSFPRIYAWTENFKEALVIKESRPDRNKLQKYVKRQMDQLINASTT